MNLIFRLQTTSNEKNTAAKRRKRKKKKKEVSSYTCLRSPNSVGLSVFFLSFLPSFTLSCRPSFISHSLFLSSLSSSFFSPSFLHFFLSFFFLSSFFSLSLFSFFDSLISFFLRANQLLLLP